MICVTLDCVIPIQSSVIQIIYRYVHLKCFFINFVKMVVCSFIFHKVVQRHIRSVVGYIIITSLQIVCKVCQ